MGYHPSKFQCSTMSGSHFMDGGGWKDPPVLQRDKKPGAYRVKRAARRRHFEDHLAESGRQKTKENIIPRRKLWATCNGQNSKE